MNSGQRFFHVAGNLILPTMAGYALAKLNFPGKKFIFGCLLLSMMVPFQLTMIQMYIQLAKLNMHNTVWAITLPFLSQTMFLFMARQFFFAVPNELLEAARIDRLSHACVFFRIVAPISKPLFASIAILNFTGTWNSYMVLHGCSSLGVGGGSLSAVLCRPLRQTQSAFNPLTAAAEIAAPAVYSGVGLGVSELLSQVS